ncbi:MAG TPA: NAD(P)/FAD-dependent oxidoreductase [Pseudonocardia sp.]
MSNLDASFVATHDGRELLEAKYAQEREKRLRAEGNDQYIAVAGTYSGFADDPYAGRPEPRPASTDRVDVLIVGAGIAGMVTAAELRRAGVNNFRIVEKAADFGGTWYWNRYPGIACDCESYIYLPFLEEMGYVPSEKYTGGAEIGAYLRAVARRYELYDNAVFQTQVTDVRWSGEDDRWVVGTDRGDAIRARFIVLGSGPLNRPKLPGIPGIAEFAGRQFHSSRWDYGYTGGDPDAPMVGLRDKRVAVVGTGASAVQIVPKVARDAAHLYVVQRTPSMIDSRDNGPTDADWFAGQAPGWQRRRMENFDAILAGIPQERDLIGDSWTTIWGGGAEAAATGSVAEAQALLAEMDLAQLERIRARVDQQVHHPDTAAALKPYYGRFCKRPCFSDEYLPTFNRPNVTLIDTRGRGLDRITETGIVFDGAEYPVDLIVHATGFEFGVAATRSGGFEVHGRNGRTFSEDRAHGVHSLHGIQVSGFPNLFIVGGLHHAAVSINQPLVFGDQGRHVALLVQELLERGVRTAEVRVEAEQAWRRLIRARSTYNAEAGRSCTPGAYNNEGGADERRPSVFATAFGGGPIEYRGLLEWWRAESVHQDLELGFERRASDVGGAR